MEIDEDCPFCGTHLKDIDFYSKQYCFANHFLSTITDFCPISINGSMHFSEQIDWIETSFLI